MANARGLIDEARSHLANVRRRLLHPEPAVLDAVMLDAVLDDALPRLERAIGLLRQGEMLLTSQTSPTERSQAWDSARQLRHELAQVNALARQANEFYAGRIRLLSGEDFAVCYNSSAKASVSEKRSEKGLVLHG